MTDILMGVALLGLGAWLVLRRIRAVRGLGSASTAAFQQRLLTPDWALYAQHLQREVPAEFKALYQEYALLLSTLELGVHSDLTQQHWLVTEFFAMDAQAVEEQKGFADAEKHLGFAVLPFGTCGGADLFLKPNDPANQIWLYVPAAQTAHVLFDSVAAFAAELRTAATR